MTRRIQTSPATAIRAITVNFAPFNYPAAEVMQVDVDSTPRVSFYVQFFNPPDAGSDLKADWDALQEIHASSDGLQDSDGNAVTPWVGGFSHGTTFEALAEYGYFNPLVAGSFEAWEERLRFGGAFLTGNEFTRDADTRKVTAKVAHHIEPMASVSASGVVEVDMSRWHAFKKAADNEFGVTLRIDEGEGVSAAGLSDYPEIMAMKSYLDENRIGSPPIGANVNLPESWANPDTLGFRNLGTLGSLFFDVTGLTQVADSSAYTLFQLDCEQDTAQSTLDVTAAVSTLNNWLWGREVEVTTDDAIDESRIGKPTAALYASRLRGAGGILGVENAVVTLRRPGDMTIIGAGQGLSMDWQAGPIVGTQPADGMPETHTLPTPFAAYNTNVIHYRRDVAGDKLQLPDPRTHFNLGQHHALWDIHNIGTEKLRLTDPTDNDDVMLGLRPGQYCQVQILRLPDGSGEILFTRAPERRLTATQTTGFNELDINLELNAGSFKYLMLPMFENVDTADDNDLVHFQYDEEAFEFGTHSSDHGGAAVSWGSRNVWDHDKAFRLLIPGELRLTLHCAIEVDPSPTGTTSGSTTIRLIALKDGFTPGAYDEFVANTHLGDGFYGARHVEPFDLAGVAHFPSDIDLEAYIHAFYIHSTGSNRYGGDDLELASYAYQAELKPLIRREYT